MGNKESALLRKMIIGAFPLLGILSSFVVAGTPSDKKIYQDPKEPMERRVQDLLSRMTLEEKLSQMMSRTPTPLPRLGLEAYDWSGQACHSVNAKTGDTTIFPHGIAQGATWNRDLLLQIATAVSDELRARFHAGVADKGLTFWSPVVELARDPRWGRTHECYGEDPYLTSQLSLACVKGLQGNHPRYIKTIVAPKHFVANNEEWCRHNGSSDIDEQLLREYYLKPYQVLVEEGHVQSIMAAYNALNGVPCAANKELLTDILRDEWGFDGCVVCDCNGIKDIFQGHRYTATVQEAIAASLNAGIDIECGNYFKVHLPEVVASGMVSEATIDRALRGIMLARFRLGLYDPPELVPYTDIPLSVVGSSEHRALARQASRESIVLLKNGGDLLPLDQKKIKTVAVIGPNAAVAQLGGYTRSHSKTVSPLEGIQNKVGPSRVFYEKGCDIKLVLPPLPTEQLIPAKGKPGEHGLRGEYFNSVDFSGKPVIVRVDPLLDFNFSRGSPDASVQVDYFSVRWTGRFVAPSTGAYYIGAVFDDAIRLYLDGKLLIDTWNNRNQSSMAKRIDVIGGQPYDLKIEYCEHWYKSAFRLFGASANAKQFDPAVEIARKTDAAIVFLGTDTSVEKEGVDRSYLDLPGLQEELIKAVYAANPNTIAVFQNGSALSFPWLKENIPSLLVAWYSGEESGNAIADVLFGDYNPGGRLPLTFYKSVAQLPPFRDYDIRKGRTYMAEIRKGGSYTAQTDEPLYPFGYGLSYTQFGYSDLKIEPENITSKGSVTIQATIKNVGDRTGDEVVQLYVRDVESSIPRPLKKLEGFSRIKLQPQESRTVRFTVPAQQLAFWDVDRDAWVVEPGSFKVLVGRSSSDIELTGSFVVE